MNADQALILWNARWVLMAGAVVCGDCQRRQTLGENDRPFDHGLGCNNINDAGTTPWADLHDILDVVRGDPVETGTKRPDLIKAV